MKKARSLGRSVLTGAELPPARIPAGRATAPFPRSGSAPPRPTVAHTRRPAPFLRPAASNERALGAALREMRDGGIYELLGFVRLGDYVVESLGLSYRTVQELIRAEEALDALPRLAEAFEEGEISAAHVRILTSAAAEILQAAGLETEVDSFVLSVSLPLWMRGLWRDTITFVRQLAGSPLSAGSALKEVLAESSASGDGLGRAAALPPMDPAPGRASSGTSDPVEAGFGLSHLDPVQEPNAGDCTGLRVVAEGDSESLDDRKSDPEAGSCTGAGTPERAARPVYDIAAHVAARDLDIRLREIVRVRQHLEAEMASRLAAARAAESWYVHGCFSLAEYAREHLGVSERQMYYLLARAHVTGRLTLRQTLLIGRVATKAMTSEWVRRAERVTLRRLEDEVEYYDHLREVRPEVWRLLEEGPLPEGIELVPGRRPRSIEVPAAPSWIRRISRRSGATTKGFSTRD